MGNRSEEAVSAGLNKHSQCQPPPLACGFLPAGWDLCWLLARGLPSSWCASSAQSVSECRSQQTHLWQHPQVAHCLQLGSTPGQKAGSKEHSRQKERRELILSKTQGLKKRRGPEKTGKAWGHIVSCRQYTTRQGG